MSFNGANERVQIGDIEMGAYSEISITAWFKTGVANENKRIVSKDQVGTPGNFILWQNSSNNWEFIIQDTVLGDWQRATYPSTLENDNEWHFIAGIVDQATDKIYLYMDGVLVAEDNFTAATLDDSGNEILVVGADSDIGVADHLFNCSIDDVRIYNRALTPQEINRLYQMGGGVTIVPPVCSSDTVMDADGNVYNTVAIGTQCWMAENLNVGTRVAVSTTQSDNATIEKWCYDNLDANCDPNNNPNNPDGGLYQWGEAMSHVTTEGAQGICPLGWHIPTDDEFKTLELALGMSPAVVDNTSFRGTDQGTQLKPGGTSGFEGNLAGYGFSASFSLRGSYGFWWSSSPSGGSSAWTRFLNSGSAQVNRSAYGQTNGLSVRCLED